MEQYQNAIDDLDTDEIAYFSFKKYKKCIKTMKHSLAQLKIKNTQGTNRDFTLKQLVTYESDVYYHLGLAYCRLEKFEKSIHPYTKCIEKIPSDIRYIHERAKAY